MRSRAAKREESLHGTSKPAPECLDTTTVLHLCTRAMRQTEFQLPTHHRSITPKLHAEHAHAIHYAGLCSPRGIPLPFALHFDKLGLLGRCAPLFLLDCTRGLLLRFCDAAREEGFWDEAGGEGREGRVAVCSSGGMVQRAEGRGDARCGEGGCRR